MARQTSTQDALSTKASIRSKWLRVRLAVALIVLAPLALVLVLLIAIVLLGLLLLAFLIGIPIILPFGLFVAGQRLKKQRELESRSSTDLTVEQKADLAHSWYEFGKSAAQGMFSDKQKAREAFRRACDFFEQSNDPCPSNPRNRLTLARSLHNLALQLRETSYHRSPNEHFRQIVEARDCHCRADQLFLSLFEEFPQNLDVRASYADLLLRQGKRGEARQLLAEILRDDPQHDLARRLKQSAASDGAQPVLQSTLGSFGSGPSVPPEVFEYVSKGAPRTGRGAFDQEGDPGVFRDLVDCTVFAPTETQAGTSLLVQVFFHTPLQADTANRDASEFDADAARRGATTLATEVTRGSCLEVELSCGGLEVDEPVQQCVWRGRPQSLQFEVRVPREHDPQQVLAKLMVRQDTVPIGRVLFKVTISDAKVRKQSRERIVGAAQRFTTSFASYASPDRSEVLRRVQMLRAAGIRCFQDVLELDPGVRWERELFRYIDESDVLFLFWSTAAKNSPWVEREWRYGLERKGDEFIVPVVIEGPPPVPPPVELAHMHFNDQVLYFLHAEAPSHGTEGQ